MSLPSINFLYLTVPEILPRQDFSRCLLAHPDTMGENNTLTALKGCGVKTIMNEDDNMIRVLGILFRKFSYYIITTFPQALQWCLLFIIVNTVAHSIHCEVSWSLIHFGALFPKSPSFSTNVALKSFISPLDCIFFVKSVITFHRVICHASFSSLVSV